MFMQTWTRGLTRAAHGQLCRLPVSRTKHCHPRLQGDWVTLYKVERGGTQRPHGKGGRTGVTLSSQPVWKGLIVGNGIVPRRGPR